MIWEFMAAIGQHFSEEQYLLLTRIQGILWTTADIVIIVYLIRIANLIRGTQNQRPHRVPAFVLAATVPFALAIPIAGTGAAIFRLELIVTIPHFLLIAYLCVANAQIAAQFVSTVTIDSRHTTK